MDKEVIIKEMNTNEFIEFIDNLHLLPEDEILAKLPQIYKYYYSCNWLEKKEHKEYIDRILKVVEKHKAIEALFGSEEKFITYNKKLDFPENIKYGVEIEVANINIEEIKKIFNDNLVQDIYEVLGVPKDISNQIIQNAVFNKSGSPVKWNFSKEAVDDESEASSPILHNELNDLNQISAICSLFKVLGAKLHGDTGLHINVGVDYFECNEKAIEYLLKIWAECEELFFKVANSEGEIIRVMAPQMATPIKENIQDFFEDDGSVTLKTEEDFEKFLYQIQARNRMDEILAWVDLEVGDEYYLMEDYYFADATENDEEKLKIYRRYHRATIEKNVNNKVRYTSINFNHMKWNDCEPGRIEFRIFNSSLEPKIIFENLELVGKICSVSLELAKHPYYKKDIFGQLCSHDISENEKIDLMLDLLFDNQNQKNIYKKRWEIIKDNDEYSRLKSGKDTFSR